MSACAEEVGGAIHVAAAPQGLKLNPYYEFVRELDLCNPVGGYGYYQDLSADLGWKVKRLFRRRPEFAPFFPEFDRHPSCTSYRLRDWCRKVFSFGVPTPAAIKRIASFGRITEIGAGSGYWASLLAGAGAQVAAYDDGSWNLSAGWYEVKQGGPVYAKKAADLLLLCWPPYDTPMATEALRNFRGPRLAYCGEGEGGCTGDGAFHDLLASKWEMEDELPSLSWPGLRDRVTIWRRR